MSIVREITERNGIASGSSDWEKPAASRFHFSAPRLLSGKADAASKDGRFSLIENPVHQIVVGEELVEAVRGHRRKTVQIGAGADEHASGEAEISGIKDIPELFWNGAGAGGVKGPNVRPAALAGAGDDVGFAVAGDVGRGHASRRR